MKMLLIGWTIVALIVAGGAAYVLLMPQVSSAPSAPGMVATTTVGDATTSAMTSVSTTTDDKVSSAGDQSSGVRGSVSLGPTCPVERIPPDPQCVDKPYATTISVYHAGRSVPYLIGNSDATGVFQFPLPPGAYMLTARVGTTLPRCSTVSVIIIANAYATTTISCDTGIR